MTPPVKQLCFDTMFKNKHSHINSGCGLQLSQTVQLLGNAICFVADILIHHSCYSVVYYISKMYVR